MLGAKWRSSPWFCLRLFFYFGLTKRPYFGDLFLFLLGFLSKSKLLQRKTSTAEDFWSLNKHRAELEMILIFFGRVAWIELRSDNWLSTRNCQNSVPWPQVNVLQSSKCGQSSSKSDLNGPIKSSSKEVWKILPSYEE